MGNAGGPMIIGTYRIQENSLVWLVLWKAQLAQESLEMYRILTLACSKWMARADHNHWRYREVYALRNSCISIIVVVMWGVVQTQNH